MDYPTIETASAVVSHRPPGITWIVYRDGAWDTVADAENHLEAQRVLGGGRRVPTLVDIRRMDGIDKEARDRYASPEADALSMATALVVSSRVSRVIGTFFVGLNRPGRPTRLFTDEKRALKFLEGTL